MNRQISRLAVPASSDGRARRRDDVLAGVGGRRSRRPAGQPDRARRAVHDQARRRSARGACSTRVNRDEKVGGRTLYFRGYPQRGLAAHVVGYSTQSRSRAGLERSMNDYLTGLEPEPLDGARHDARPAQGRDDRGERPRADAEPARPAGRDARRSAARCGAVVALELRTGKVLVMASSPTYDPNLVEGNFGRDRPDIGAAASGRTRSTTAPRTGLYAPGSTFKVVTAAAAIDSGRYTPDLALRRPRLLRGLRQAGQQLRHDVPFGRVDLRQRSSTRSTPSSATSARTSARRCSSTTRSASASTRPRRSRRPTNERAPSGLYKGTKLFDPRTTPTSTRAGSPSARSGCS